VIRGQLRLADGWTRRAEALTDRLDAAPCGHFGPAATTHLTELAGGFTRTFRTVGAFLAARSGKG
jgi:hypothetical protein